MKTIRIPRFPVLICLLALSASCAIGPLYSPGLSAVNSGLNLKDRTVIVTDFYKAQTQLSYLDDLEISRILESAKLYDISFNLAEYLNENKINSVAMKEASVSTLKEKEVMLSGALVTKSIPMEENFPFPGMMVVILIGNILPSPAAYISGVDVVYHYELTDSEGRILQSVEKSSRIYYKDYYIWGRIFNYQKYEKSIREKLDGEIFDLIIQDLFAEKKMP